MYIVYIVPAYLMSWIRPLQVNCLFKMRGIFYPTEFVIYIIVHQVILELTSSSPANNLKLLLKRRFVPHLTQLCLGKIYSGCHRMLVYRRVCSTPAGSPPSVSAVSQDAVPARTGRNSEYYQKSRNPLSETLTPEPQTSRRLFLKKKKEGLLQYRSWLCFLVTCKCCFDVCVGGS